MTAMAMQQFAADFHGTAVQIIDHAQRKWLTAADVGRCLGYAADNARRAILKLYDRHADEFNAEDVGVVNLTTPGGCQDTRIFSATGCIKLGFFANTTRAKDFRAWASKVLAERLEAVQGFAAAAMGRPPRITRAIEVQVLTLFVEGHAQKAIAKQLDISQSAVNAMLHGKYRFSPGAGVDRTTPALLAAVAARHVASDLERLTRKYCASAANKNLEEALDAAGRHLLIGNPSAA